MNEFKIDLAVIKQQVRALLLPEQEVRRGKRVEGRRKRCNTVRAHVCSKLQGGVFIALSPCASRFTAVQLLVVHGAHHLHDHHHLSAAVFKALKQDSVHTASSEG